MKIAGFPFGAEVPVHGGGGLHLAPHLTGDTAQLEALASHRLRVRVHLCTGGLAQGNCSGIEIIDFAESLTTQPRERERNEK